MQDFYHQPNHTFYRASETLLATKLSLQSTAVRVLHSGIDAAYAKKDQI